VNSGTRARAGRRCGARTPLPATTTHAAAHVRCQGSMRARQRCAERQNLCCLSFRSVPALLSPLLKTRLVGAGHAAAGAAFRLPPACLLLPACLCLPLPPSTLWALVPPLAGLGFLRTCLCPHACGGFGWYVRAEHPGARYASTPPLPPFLLSIKRAAHRAGVMALPLWHPSQHCCARLRSLVRQRLAYLSTPTFKKTKLRTSQEHEGNNGFL